MEIYTMRVKKTKHDFRTMLGKYTPIKGLDIIVYLKDGQKVELLKNREIQDETIVMFDKRNTVTAIPLNTIVSVDLFAI